MLRSLSQYQASTHVMQVGCSCRSMASRAIASGTSFIPASSSLTSRRWNSQISWDDEAPKRILNKPRDRRQIKNKFQRAQVWPPPAPTEEELKRQAERRVQRAERLERKDLTAQLTETKTYMGGFTQPRHLAFLNTLDPTRKEKDSLAVRAGESRVRPSQEAYEPHCVYLAATRYPVRWGPGRATRRESFSGFCKASELPNQFRRLNYGIWHDAYERRVKSVPGTAPEIQQVPAGWDCDNASRELLDLAVWPGSPQERSLLNKPAWARRRALEKELAKAQKDDSKGDEVIRIQKEIEELPPHLPPVSPDWLPPLPPYVDPPAVNPIFVVTLPTRPLAASLARLCNAHPRGLPFISSVPNHDRKDGPPLFRRLTRMRADRTRQVTEDIIRKLKGEGGGLFGLRFTSEDKGRGISGEALGQDIATPKLGWAQIQWLDEKSEAWNGLERDMLVAAWQGIDGLSEGPSLTDSAEVGNENL